MNQAKVPTKNKKHLCKLTCTVKANLLPSLNSQEQISHTNKSHQKVGRVSTSLQISWTPFYIEKVEMKDKYRLNVVIAKYNAILNN